MRLFDRAFAITRVLPLLAAVIAFAGVSSALERTRELGPAIAGARHDTSGALWPLAGRDGAHGSHRRPPLGAGGGGDRRDAVYVLYERCFGWSMDLHVDPVILAQGVGPAVVAALLAGIYPARRAARRSPAAVLRND